MNAPLWRTAEDVFSRFVDVLLPRGGSIVLLEAYFDESIGTATHAAADGRERAIRIMCVAGYLIETEQAKRLSEEWQAVLDRSGLPFFHMVDCAHGNGPFKGKSDRECLYAQTQMMGIIKRRTICGFAVAVNLHQFEQLVPPSHPAIGSAYSFCTQLALAGVERWIEARKYTGRVGYFFEAGHQSRGEADRVMGTMIGIPELKAAMNYAGHAFLGKREALPLQAADLLAWQFYTSARRQLEGKTKHRLDYASLIQHPHHVTFMTPEKIAEYVTAVTDSPWPEWVRRQMTGFSGAAKSGAPSDGQPS